MGTPISRLARPKNHGVLPAPGAARPRADQSPPHFRHHRSPVPTSLSAAPVQVLPKLAHVLIGVSGCLDRFRLTVDYPGQWFELRGL